MRDREIAYEQNVTGLEKAWEARISVFAAEAVRNARRTEDGHDAVQDAATEAVAAKLFDSLQWENVEATDISDIAYEAVNRALDSEPSDVEIYGAGC